ncbi:hypothetical protein SAMN04488113_10477 [Alkalibacterium gilvum]|uniref:Uncharacterized protein n=1 Tax=Alkalibacterium gilvum TaxID=1130080 RepID=A0A1H6RZ77_9LACT|nr:hypothetical protein [Alkalibacterium gilvum]SEI58904.1 hypothetical protein SAMN04488113_10477 [Alkalibacterium gilvum]
MRINRRIKRLEKVKGSNEVNVYVAWPEEDGYIVKRNGEPDKAFTFKEWEAFKEENPEAYCLEVDWT